MCTTVVTAELVAVNLPGSTATRRRTHGICCSARRTRRTLTRLHGVLKPSTHLVIGTTVAIVAAVASTTVLVIPVVMTAPAAATAEVVVPRSNRTVSPT